MVAGWEAGASERASERCTARWVELCRPLSSSPLFLRTRPAKCRLLFIYRRERGSRKTRGLCKRLLLRMLQVCCLLRPLTVAEKIASGLHYFFSNGWFLSEKTPMSLRCSLKASEPGLRRRGTAMARSAEIAKAKTGSAHIGAWRRSTSISSRNSMLR